jgi:hypothetical protein
MLFFCVKQNPHGREGLGVNTFTWVSFVRALASSNVMEAATTGSGGKFAHTIRIIRQFDYFGFIHT